MPNSFFQFKQFTVHHERCAMKVTTDACVFGAWVADEVKRLEHQPERLLDIGAGSGLLSMMVAQKNQGCIDAVEIDAAAAEQATENVATSPWENQIHVFHQDVLQWETQTRYDVIFTNPPFYEKEIRSVKSSRNIAHHDEGLKLDALFDFIRNHLTEDGSFFLLLPAKREKEVETLLHTRKLFVRRKVMVQQTPRHRPFRILLHGQCHESGSVAVSNLVIQNEAGEYSPDFIRLLSDYYLYL